MGLVGASTVEDQLVLGVADPDLRVVVGARVGAGGRAVGWAARALLLGGDGLAVGDVSDVGALAAVGAGSDGLEVVLGMIHTYSRYSLSREGIMTYHKVASDVALENGQAVLGADVLAEGARLGGCHGRGGEGDDGSGELHFEVWGLKGVVGVGLNYGECGKTV